MAKILVVDDEKSIRKTFEIFLNKENHTVFTADNAETALSIIADNKLDLIIADIIMPKNTGIDLLQKIRSTDNDISIIIMTGEPSVETAKDALKYNAQDYLLKPVSKEVLLKTVRFAIEKKILIDEKKQLEIENRKYRENLEIMVDQKTKELQLAIIGTIETIGKILEHKDPYTAGHVKKVGNLSFSIAKKMGVDHEEQKKVYFAGYLHDIGKIMVASEILSKPGKLSNGEFTVIKEHVNFAYDILKKINLPWDISDIILQHHERLDGSGYPNGLKENEISLGAKILSVADVIEAMVSHRPYRPSLGIDKALNEISLNCGKLYDKEVCTAAISLFKDDNYSFSDSNFDFKI